MTSTLGASPTTDTQSGSGTIAQAKDVALEKTEAARQQVSDRIREQADQRSTAVGEQISSVTSALKDTSESLRSNSGGEMPAKALDAVTTQVEKVGSYLTESNGEQLLHDLEDAARRRPWAIAATMFGIGFAASRVLGATSRTRYKSRGGTPAAPRRTGGYVPYPSTSRTPDATMTNAAVLPPVETTGSVGGGVGNGRY